jgi:hypothetical protein
MNDIFFYKIPSAHSQSSYAITLGWAFIVNCNLYSHQTNYQLDDLDDFVSELHYTHDQYTNKKAQIEALQPQQGLHATIPASIYEGGLYAPTMTGLMLLLSREDRISREIMRAVKRYNEAI